MVSDLCSDRCYQFKQHLIVILDITFNSGPTIINRYLSDDEKQRYFKPGYRFRIVKLASPLAVRPTASLT